MIRPSYQQEVGTGVASHSGEGNARAQEAPRDLISAYAIGLVLLVGGGAVAVFARVPVDYPVVLFLNRFGNVSATVDAVISALTRLDLLKGVMLIAGAYFVWFATPELRERAKLLAGICGAAAAGLFSRILQLTLPTHPRPLHDPALHFIPPTWVRQETLNNWDSFPSDHASLLFALAMAIYIVRPAIGLAAFIWALVLCSSRVYCGLHFPSDVVGGIGLGVLVVCMSQITSFRQVSAVMASWATKRAPAFYATTFIATYLIATLFDDVRSLGKGVTKLLPLHAHSASISDVEYPITGVPASSAPQDELLGVQPVVRSSGFRPDGFRP